MTIRGRCLLAAGFTAALCSVVLNERDLLRVAMFVVILPVLAGLLTARARAKLLADRHVVPPRVSVGSSADVRLEIRSTGRLPSGGLLLEDGVPYALGGRPRFVVERLPRNASAALNYPLHPVLRGVHEVGPLVARLTDPFGLAQFDRQLAGHTRLVVVPQVVAFRGLPGGAAMGSGDNGMVRLHAGQGEDDAIVRPYRHGDDLRRVHWRSTARRDELMVRVDERPWRGGTTVLLDHRLVSHRGSGATSSLEWAVSFAASVYLHLHRYGQQVRLVVEDGRLLAGGSDDEGHSDAAALDALAALQPSHRRDLAFTDDPAAGQEVIAVLGAATPSSAAELVRFRPRGTRSFAVLLDVSRWDAGSDESAPNPANAARVLRGVGWGVAIARPGDAMPEVWDQLCRSGTDRTTALFGEADR